MAFNFPFFGASTPAEPIPPVVRDLSGARAKPMSPDQVTMVRGLLSQKGFDDPSVVDTLNSLDPLLRETAIQRLVTMPSRNANVTGQLPPEAADLPPALQNSLLASKLRKGPTIPRAQRAAAITATNPDLAPYLDPLSDSGQESLALTVAKARARKAESGFDRGGALRALPADSQDPASSLGDRTVEGMSAREIEARRQALIDEYPQYADTINGLPPRQVGSFGLALAKAGAGLGRSGKPPLQRNPEVLSALGIDPKFASELDDTHYSDLVQTMLQNQAKGRSTVPSGLGLRLVNDDAFKRSGVKSGDTVCVRIN